MIYVWSHQLDIEVAWAAKVRILYFRGTNIVQIINTFDFVLYTDDLLE